MIPVVLGLIALWAVSATIMLAVLAGRNTRAWRRLNEMLERLIEGQPLEDVSFEERELSLISNQLKTISDKLAVEVGRANQEKEQVKQLISNISHQLKTPLANVMMYEELLESRDLTEEQKTIFTQKLRNQTEKIDWLLHSLFKMTKLEQNAMEFQIREASIRETVRAAVRAVYEKASQKGIEIRADALDDVRLLHDPKWTSEIFENLLENAIKYTMGPGSVRLSLEQLENYSVIHVADNGRGIPEHELPHVFERFYRGKEAEGMEGSGIGLYLSKLILEQEKGYMTVKSQMGQGSIFSVFLQNC
ncbi:MAG: HAMP domain-containing histidine kinase [Firmicutes bacterium]|nr:HAMP domain-containing histidine kinase [Bacillota bacterium]